MPADVEHRDGERQEPCLRAGLLRAVGDGLGQFQRHVTTVTRMKELARGAVPRRFPSFRRLQGQPRPCIW